MFRQTLKKNVRFGNHFIILFITYLLGLKYNVPVILDINTLNKCKELGIIIKNNKYSKYDSLKKYNSCLYCWESFDKIIYFQNHINNHNKNNINKDRIKFTKEIDLKDKNIIDLFNDNYIIDKNILYNITGFHNNQFLQSPKIMNILIDYFNHIDNIQCKNIINHNKYSSRYNNNNDLFIHVRTGDVFNNVDIDTIYPSIHYYELILDKKHTYNIKYISSDNIDHPLCQLLIKKYHLVVYINNEIDTILFGSTCKDIIISSGTYSFLIGLLSFYSKNVYISQEAGLDIHGIQRWHPDFYPEFLHYNKYNQL